MFSGPSDLTLNFRRRSNGQASHGEKIMQGWLKRDTASSKVQATVIVNQPLDDDVVVWSGTINFEKSSKPETRKYTLTLDDGRSGEVEIVKIREAERLAYFVGTMNRK